jgi:GTP cyclohydrolase I
MPEKIPEDIWSEILKHIGEDIKRPGLKDTPKRVSKMYSELFFGYDERNKPNVTVFPNGEDGLIYDQMIIDTGKFTSFCEHHMLPFTGTYTFAYIPHEEGQIVGLSKIARVIDYFSARLQVQERLGQQVMDEIWNELSKSGNPPQGMAILLKAQHMCKKIRGVKNNGQMTTIALRGLFKKDQKTREEFLILTGKD